MLLRKVQAARPRSARKTSNPRWRIPDLLARAKEVELDLVEARVIEPGLKHVVGLWARDRGFHLQRIGSASP